MQETLDFVTLVESLNLGIVCQDKEYKIIYSNPAAEQILGLSKEQVYGLTSYDVRWKTIYEDGTDFPADDHPIVQALTSGIVVKDVIMGIFNSKINDYKWIKVSGIPIYGDQSQTPIQAIAIFEDISERIRLENSLIDSEKKILNLIDFAPFGSHQYYLNQDHELIFLNYNKSANKILGIDQSILLGKTIESAFPGLSKDIIELYKNVAMSAIPAHIEEVIYETEQIKGVFDVYAIQPSPGNIVSFFIDISEKKNASEKLYKLNEELEKRVLERTQKLELINHELETFCYSVAHDFKAPLRAINGQAHKIQEDFSKELTPELNVILDNINHSSVQLNKMLDSVLFLNNISRRTLHLLPTNLSTLALSIIDKLKSKHESKEIIFTCQEDMIVQADPDLMETMLHHLIENAYKYSLMKDKIEISFNSTVLNSQQTFRIEDHGMGFNMCYYNQLFQPFRRLHSNAKIEGMGIGLLISQRIILRHHGKIWLESQENLGTTLFFTIDTI